LVFRISALRTSATPSNFTPSLISAMFMPLSFHRAVYTIFARQGQMRFFLAQTARIGDSIA